MGDESVWGGEGDVEATGPVRQSEVEAASGHGRARGVDKSRTLVSRGRKEKGAACLGKVTAESFPAWKPVLKRNSSLSALFTTGCSPPPANAHAGM